MSQLLRPRLLIFYSCVVAVLIAAGPYTQGAARAAEASSTAGRIEFDRFEKNLFYFTAPPGAPAIKPVTAELYDIQYLGALYGPGNGMPYFLFKARTCQNCIQDLAIHVLRPGRGEVTSFVYPGRILEPKHRDTVMDSRAFIGRCVRDTGDAYVVFQREYIDKRHGFQSSVFVAEASDDHFNEQLIERRPPRVKDTLARVRRKECKEIDGRNRIAISRPLNMRVMGADDDDEGDSEDEDDTTPSGGVPAPKAAGS